MNTPVLLITFNRPDYTKQVLAALKMAKVEQLYVFRDGPRPLNDDDKRKAKEIEVLIKEIDWPCKVTTNFMQNNLGCGWGPFSAISWAFQYTDRLIILEDDCVPSTAFFGFCDYLLEKYKDNRKVRHISGLSPINHTVFDKYDYVFTNYGATCGWATWKRVWEDMDLHERLISKFFKNGGYKQGQYAHEYERKVHNRIYKLRTPLKEVLHSWDYQYGVHSKMGGAYSIVPSCNLITNIGIEGTHYDNKDNNLHPNAFINLNASHDFVVSKEPSEIKLNADYEAKCFQLLHPKYWKATLKSYLILIKHTLFGRPDFNE